MYIINFQKFIEAYEELKLRRISEQLLKDYDEAYKRLAKGNYQKK